VRAKLASAEAQAALRAGACMGDAEPSPACVGSFASLSSEGSWRARFFVTRAEGGAVLLQHLDDVLAPGPCPPVAHVVVECVLPDGVSVEFAGVRADETTAHIKERLLSRATCDAEPGAPDEAPAAAGEPAAPASAEVPSPPPCAAVADAADDDEDDVDALFAQFKQLQKVQAAPAPATPAPAATAGSSAPVRLPKSGGAALEGAPDDSQAAAPPAAPASVPLQGLDKGAAAAVDESTVTPCPRGRDESTSAGAASPALAAAQPTGAHAAAQLPVSVANALAAVSWACAGAQAVGSWQPAAHLAALCAAVALLATLCGYVAFSTLVVAVMYARVVHEQHAREAAQAQLVAMRTEVAAAHRQIAATVAALARADECSGGAVRTHALDVEHSEWLNTALAACWTGWLAAWLSATLSSAVSDGLRQKCPPGLEDISLSSLSFDSAPPRLTSPRALRSQHHDADGETTLAFTLSLVGDVGLLLRLAARVSLLRATVQLPIAFRASEADVNVALTFMQVPPYVRLVRVSLMAPPRIAVSCRPFGALKVVDVTDIPGVDAWVQGAVVNALRRILVEPAGHEWDILDWWIAEEGKRRAAERAVATRGANDA
jgi:hypothetical protein